MPLYLAPTGEELTIVSIAAEDRLKTYLHSLGIAVSTKVVRLSGDARGVTLQVMVGKLALDGVLARKIFVSF